MKSVVTSFLKAVVKGTLGFIASGPLDRIVQTGGSHDTYDIYDLYDIVDINDINKYDMAYSGHSSKPPLNSAVETIENEILSDDSWSPKLFFRLTT